MNHLWLAFLIFWVSQYPMWLFRNSCSECFFPCFASHSGEGNGTPLQYSCLENPVDGRAWWATVHGVTKSQTPLSYFTFTFHFHTLEKEMVTHSSVYAWRIPGTGEPGGLPSMGSHGVRHDWSDLAAAASHSTGTPGSSGRQVSLVFMTSVILFTCCLVFSVPQGPSSVPGHRDGRQGGIRHFCHPGLIHCALCKSMTILCVLFTCCHHRLSDYWKLGSEADSSN